MDNNKVRGVDLEQSVGANDLGIDDGQGLANVQPIFQPEDNKQVLLAEDCPDTRALMALILRKLGFQVFAAENGKECIDLSGQVMDEVDIVVLDIGLPLFDGYTISQKLREDGYSGPIIATSATPMPNDENECKVHGCNAFLPKADVREKIAEMVRHYMR